MAENDPPNEPSQDDRLAAAFAKGLELYENGRAERLAKEQAANPPKEGSEGGDSTGKPKRGPLDFLLG